jgi:general secretion pathway protein A
MYTHYYGFKEKPFKLVPDPRYLYLSDAHKAALSHLKYGLEDRNGFVVVTGEVGCGKTLLLRVLINELPRSTRIARVINTNFNAKELLEHVLNEFGVETHGETKPRMIALLTQVLLKSFSEGNEAVLVIDEAQNLSIDAIEELRMISNLETNTAKLVQIVMVGQPQLRRKMNHPDLEQLKQRVTVQYHLSALDEPDTTGYVNHRLKIAKAGRADIFTAEAMKMIYAYSRGIPRLINVVADAALRLGYVEEKKVLDEKLLTEVIQELKEIGDTEEGETHVTREVSTPPLDQTVIELNKKFQGLYDKMQAAYNQKDEENRILYERLQNIEKEMKAKEGFEGIEARERMVFEKEEEINRRLIEVSKKLEEVNSIKENLEGEKLQIQEKVAEFDSRLMSIKNQEAVTQEKGGSLKDSEAVLKQKVAEFEKIQKRIQKREVELQDRIEDLRQIIYDLEKKKELLDAIEQDKTVEERLLELEKQQVSVRLKEEELLKKISLLEESMMRSEQEPVTRENDSTPPKTVFKWKQEELLLELIPRVDSLKSEIDSLEAQKELLDSMEGWKNSYPSRIDQIEKNFGSLKEKEVTLLRMIQNIKNSFKPLQDKTIAVDELTERFFRKEQRLERRLDELREIILRIEGKGALLSLSEVEPILVEGSSRPSPEGLLGGPPAGRQFNLLIREILKE